MKDRIPYLVENKERDTFTIYVKGTKPYLELQLENKQLKEEKKKAREFIEKNFIRYKDSENGLVLNELSLINIEEIKKLLEILGGIENE